MVLDPKKIYLGRMSKNSMTGPTMAANLELEKKTLKGKRKEDRRKGMEISQKSEGAGSENCLGFGF